MNTLHNYITIQTSRITVSPGSTSALGLALNLQGNSTFVITREELSSMRRQRQACRFERCH